VSMWPKSPTFWYDCGVGYVSVPFTWDLPRVADIVKQTHLFVERWVAGGPAVRLMPEFLCGLPAVTVDTGSFAGVLQRVNRNATRTTVGCVRRCQFCAVPRTEGALVELDEWPDLPIVCDNNITAASHEHFDRVMDRLDNHDAPEFNQGIDCRLLTDHHAERIGRHRGMRVRLALDRVDERDAWDLAWGKLRKYNTAKARISSYVLCAFDSGVDDAWERCEWVERHGALAMPMWYHALDATEYNAVTEAQKGLGWTKKAQRDIMGYYWQHRGKRNAPQQPPPSAEG
jgi:hypothetical protein